MYNEIELPPVVTFADLVEAQREYHAYMDGNGTCRSHCRLRLNAIAERLGLVDRKLTEEIPGKD